MTDIREKAAEFDTADQVDRIMTAIRDAEETDKSAHEELRIGIPLGLGRFDAPEQFSIKQPRAFFDLIYNEKRLRFAVEIRSRSESKTVLIKELYKRKKTNYTINEPLRLSIADTRRLVGEIAYYFAPLVFNIYTIAPSDAPAPPDHYLSETGKKIG